MARTLSSAEEAYTDTANGGNVSVAIRISEHTDTTASTDVAKVEPAELQKGKGKGKGKKPSSGGTTHDTSEPPPATGAGAGDGAGAAVDVAGTDTDSNAVDTAADATPDADTEAEANAAMQAKRAAMEARVEKAKQKRLRKKAKADEEAAKRAAEKADEEAAKRAAEKEADAEAANTNAANAANATDADSATVAGGDAQGGSAATCTDDATATAENEGAGSNTSADAPPDADANANAALEAKRATMEARVEKAKQARLRKKAKADDEAAKRAAEKEADDEAAKRAAEKEADAEAAAAANATDAEAATVAGGDAQGGSAAAGDQTVLAVVDDATTASTTASTTAPVNTDVTDDAAADAAAEAKRVTMEARVEKAKQARLRKKAQADEEAAKKAAVAKARLTGPENFKSAAVPKEEKEESQQKTTVPVPTVAVEKAEVAGEQQPAKAPTVAKAGKPFRCFFRVIANGDTKGTPAGLMITHRDSTMQKVCVRIMRELKLWAEPKHLHGLDGSEILEVSNIKGNVTYIARGDEALRGTGLAEKPKASRKRRARKPAAEVGLVANKDAAKGAASKSHKPVKRSGKGAPIPKGVGTANSGTGTGTDSSLTDPKKDKKLESVPVPVPVKPVKPRVDLRTRREMLAVERQGFQALRTELMMTINDATLMEKEWTDATAGEGGLLGARDFATYIATRFALLNTRSVVAMGFQQTVDTQSQQSIHLQGNRIGPRFMPRLLLNTFHMADLFSLLGLQSGKLSDCEAIVKRGLCHCFKRLLDKKSKTQPKDEAAAAKLVGAKKGAKGLPLFVRLCCWYAQHLLPADIDKSWIQKDSDVDEQQEQEGATPTADDAGLKSRRMSLSVSKVLVAQDALCTPSNVSQLLDGGDAMDKFRDSLSKFTKAKPSAMSCSLTSLGTVMDETLQFECCPPALKCAYRVVTGAQPSSASKVVWKDLPKVISKYVLLCDVMRMFAVDDT